MNKFLTKIATFSVGLAMAIGVGVAVGSGRKATPAYAESNDVYYTFNNKDWTSNMNTADYATSGGTSKKWSGVPNDEASDGSQLTSGQGVQITTGYSGIIVTCPDSYSNITGVVIRYCTNASKGVGSLVAKVGSTTGSPSSFSITKPSSGGTTLKNASFTFSNATGAVNFTVGCSTNSVYIYGVKITYTVEEDPDQPSVSITNNNLYAPKNVGVSLSASTENAPQGSYVEWTANNNKVSFSSATGTSTTLTAANDATVSTTAVIVTATLKNSGGEALDSKTTKLYISSTSGSSTATAMPASEAALFAAVEELRGKTIYVKGFVTNIPGNSTKYFWIDDNEGTTQTFEVYKNETGFSNGTSLGAFVVAHGTLAIYNSTKETTDSVIDSSDYFSLGDTEVEVNNTQYVDVTATSATGNITWTPVAGTGSVTLSNQSNTGVRITGASVGTATVTATVGNLTRTISVTVNKYATDWAFSDITLTTNGEFQDTYYVGGELDVENLTVDYIEHSNSLNEDRHPTVNMNNVTFNFDSSEPGSFNLTATYNEHTTDDVITIYIVERPDGIEFNNINYTQLSTSVLTDSANDANDVSWTVSATFSGDVSVTKTAAHIQIGSGSKRADSVQITADLGSAKTFTKLAFKCDAFSGDSGTISLKLDDTEIASGSINETSVITVEPNNYVKGQEIQIDITNSGNLRVNLISVEYQAYTDDEMVSNFVRDNMHMDYDKDGVHGSTGGNGSCKSQGWYTTAKTNYGKLLDSQKLLFNTESKYAAAKQRLIDWAIANTEEFDPEAYTFTAQNSRAAFEGFVGSDNPSVISMIIVISLVSVTAIGGYFFMRKRKEIK